MSYARWTSDSDVYVFLHSDGALECCGCLLAGPYRSFSCIKTSKMLEHLKRHLAAGHQVPDYCMDRLKDEAKENDSWIKRRIKQNGGVK